mmetsp:Transcript_19531/g.14236  ORF Transcript_19531/g.14236 Transcript_19531/m.14236 type:complete len:80 (+) Transcript_19531:775-1014(+)
MPPVPGSINYGSLSNPILTTNWRHKGNYSNNLSNMVTERKRVSKGNYIVIPSTFNPQQMGKFELVIYSSLPLAQCTQYQ